MESKVFRKALRDIERYARESHMDGKVLIQGVENDIIRFDLVKKQKSILEDGTYKVDWKLWHGVCRPDTDDLNVFDTEEGFCVFSQRGYQIGGEYNYTVFND